MKQIISILICAWFATTINAQSLSKEAKILFEIRPEVNYVTHLYTLAGLGFSDEEYTAKYGSTLPKIAGQETEDYRRSALPLGSSKNFSEADVETFCQIYDRLSVIGIKNPSELYRKGIMEYLSHL